MAEKKLTEFKAIVTAYRGYQFRSRLEAKWAVFFDLCGWKWSYEPFDLNGWIPDFAIGEWPTLVEIKPFFNRDEWGEQINKIANSGWNRDVVLLGADPTWSAEHFDNAPQIGWLLEINHVGPDEDYLIPWELHFGFTEGNGKPGLCPMMGSWVNHIWKPTTDDHPNKWSRVREFDYVRSGPADTAREYLEERWSDASNVSQWIPVGEQHTSIRERGA